MPSIFKSLQKIIPFLLCVILIIIGIECIQLFTLTGSCDIDDFILNFLGVLLGNLLFRLCHKNQNSIDNTIILNDLIGDVDLNTLYQNTGSGNSSSNKPGTGVTYMGYDVIGYIEIPATDIKYPIIPDYQSSINSLNVAIVMLYPSNKGLNEIGNTVLAGHNYRDGTFFSNNKRLQNGDKIYITDTSGNKVTYEVYKKYETAANEATYMNRDTEGRREISLTTCTDDTKQRLIIWAKEV